MAESVIHFCSFYLRRPVRSLRDACRDIHRARGNGVPPCGTCKICDMCFPKTAHKGHAKSRRNTARPAVSR